MNNVSAVQHNPEPSYLAALNPEQREAVLAVDGPVLVLAGAGTGKTRVLTSRVAHLLHEKHAFPGQILAVTFTNKAAREMATRAAFLVWGNNAPETEGAPRGAPLPWLGTFHSIAAKILRRHAEAVGLKPTFTILDTDDQIRLLKTVLAEKNIDEKQSPAKLFLAVISGWKDIGLTPEKVTSSQKGATPQALSVYHAYQQRLLSLNAVDFGDLLLHNLTLFTTRPEILAEYATRFRYILVDEYQDTNVAQYLWLRLLAAGHKNICCVGDDDQSIYGWRGAEVGNILRFEQDFPGAKVIRLERNYRSTGNILGAAAGLIAHNQGRLGKTLWTEGDKGTPVRIHALWDGDEEARFVGEEMEALQRKNISANDMAVLVRAGFQTRAFEERFLTLGLPYRVVGGLRFYERAEVRDIVAYLRLLSSPDDDLAFERIVNLPKRGVGKATLEQIFLRARADNVPLSAATDRLLKDNILKGKIGTGLRQFLDAFGRWREVSTQLSLPELAERVLEESGYRAMWQAEKTIEAQGRLENLKELTRAMGEFEDLAAFLEHVGLVAERADTNASDMVSLMTLHAAKGLEFAAVFLPGWEEGLFPHQRALDEGGLKGLEEERRLAYVGITRAKQHLLITHAANRRIYNQWQSSLPSRFLMELPEAHTELVDEGLHRRTQIAGPRAKTGARSFSKEELEREIAAIMGSSSASVAPARSEKKSPKATFQLNERVFHVKFGYGRITHVNGDHLDIEFEKAGHKKVMADYVKPASEA